MINKVLKYCDLGLIDYLEAWELQKELFSQKLVDKNEDFLLLLEHPNTYTLGKTADRLNLKGTEDYLKENHISVYDIDRGGDITYHGPGQIVGYPIIDLNNWHKDTHKYLRALEEVIIQTCAEYNLKCERIPEYTGVWINDKKIAAIGIKISRWITMHGFAFNVDTNLNLFNGIIPCGIQDKKVTSLKNELQRDIEIKEVKQKLLNNFAEVFEYSDILVEKREEIIQSKIVNI